MAPGERGSGDESGDEVEPPDPRSSLTRTLLGLAITTAIVTVVSYTTPEAYVTTAVGMLFLAATYVLVLRHSARYVEEHGLSFGGLFEPTQLSARRIVVDTLVAVAWAVGAFAVIAIPFAIGFKAYYHLHRPFAFSALHGAIDAMPGQLLVIALPEEAFFRGFLQTELEKSFSDRSRISLLGAKVSPALLIASVFFAIGHILTNPIPGRLAVFFPSLLFGWLRIRTRGVGAGVVLHMACNLLSATLAHGYGMG